MALSIRNSIFFASFLFFHFAYSQDSPKNWELNGYVKYLHSAFLFENFPIQTDNLIHNRLNFKWYPTDIFQITAEARNRIFWGDVVKLTPNYSQLIDESGNDWIDLGTTWIDGRGVVFHSTFDRLYAEWNKGKWNARIGRQRINWGINVVWNPNDIFNAFSFIDFDYEERPGSDAVRIQYGYGFTSSVELVYKPGGSQNDYVLGALWKFNISKFDLQVLAAKSEGDVILGGGWAGNLGNWGWKGEFTSFLSGQDLSSVQKDAFAISTGFDYTFVNGGYISLGYLFNKNGNSSSPINQLFNIQLSARNLYPYKHSLFVQYQYPFTPILNGSLATIYSPGINHPLFINPALTYSIVENWDIDLVSQIVFNKEENYTSPIQFVFVRLKYSF